MQQNDSAGTGYTATGRTVDGQRGVPAREQRPLGDVQPAADRHPTGQQLARHPDAVRCSLGRVGPGIACNKNRSSPSACSVPRLERRGSDLLGAAHPASRPRASGRSGMQRIGAERFEAPPSGSATSIGCGRSSAVRAAAAMSGGTARPAASDRADSSSSSNGGSARRQHNRGGVPAGMGDGAGQMESARPAKIRSEGFEPPPNSRIGRRVKPGVTVFNRFF